MRAAGLSERELVGYVTAQRWYAAKEREVTAARVVDEADLPGGVSVALAELRFREGTHELYQLVVGEELDGLAEQATALALLRCARDGETHAAGEGAVEFEAVPLDVGPAAARPLGGEQSNTSVVFDDALILKAYRRIEPGINPELEMLRFLGERGFEHAPPLAGSYAYVGRPLDATLGIVQGFVSGGLDGWELALDLLADDPDVLLERIVRLGQVTGEMHTVLASDPDDQAFCPEGTGPETLGLLAASVDEQIERTFAELPEGVEALEPLRGRCEDVRGRLRELAHAGAGGLLIRNHGDFHLGQALWVPGAPTAPPGSGDWTILDFEGEPARPVPERRHKRSPLRDVAGMLRSFAYAASAVELLRGTPSPPAWEEFARAVFLDGYLDTVDPELVPFGSALDKLLAVFELEKAVYELRYELGSRPDWVSIPVAGILRLLEQPVQA